MHAHYMKDGLSLCPPVDHTVARTKLRLQISSFYVPQIATGKFSEYVLSEL